MYSSLNYERPLPKTLTTHNRLVPKQNYREEKDHKREQQREKTRQKDIEVWNCADKLKFFPSEGVVCFNHKSVYFVMRSGYKIPFVKNPF